MEIYTKLSRYFPGQFKQPRGLLGRLIGWLESYRNEAANDFALAHLDVGEREWVMEAGCGSGRSLQKMVRLAKGGLVAGIDISPVMLQQSWARNAAAVSAGFLLITRGDVCRLPYGDNLFNKIIMVSVIYFLPDPVACMQELYRVQMPGGRIAIYLTSKEDLEKEAFIQHGDFSLYTATEVMDFLLAAGYEKLRFETQRINNRTGICVLADKPSIADGASDNGKSSGALPDL